MKNFYSLAKSFRQDWAFSTLPGCKTLKVEHSIRKQMSDPARLLSLYKVLKIVAVFHSFSTFTPRSLLE